MKKILLLCFFLAGTFCLHGQELFRFSYSVGQRYHIEGLVEEDVYKNDILLKSVQMKNEAEITIKEVSGDRALHEGTFYYSTREGISRQFILEEEYPTRYIRDVYGNYEIDDSYFMPIVRGVPTFPENPVTIGDQWTSRAYEAHDFRKVYGISQPVLFPAAASYQYIGNTVIEGNTIAKISINYVINYTLKYQYGTRFDVPLPYRVIGYFNQLYLWNLDRGHPHSYKENFDYVFILSNGETLEYAGKSEATLTVTEQPEQRDAVIESIESRLKKDIPSVIVTGTEQGIVINVGEILFKFDSDELSDTASDDLNNIVEVLGEFENRKIRVIGHTDSTGPEDYNLSLSLRRARRTATELKRRAPELDKRMTYIGMGESSPLVSNETEEGRRKNRRVEIIIMNP
jgi:outer membrane protein OmpA-like peptidoglycan-associated protein